MREFPKTPEHRLLMASAQNNLGVVQQDRSDYQAAEKSHRHAGEVLEELGLRVTTATGWQPLPGFTAERSAGFARSFTGSGSFAALLDAIRTVESWSDRARVRSLSVAPDGPGSVRFTLEIAVVRIGLDRT